MSKKIHPPKWADRLLEWVCTEKQIEILQGDLHELFRIRTQKMGISRARVHFIWDVLTMLRPFAMRSGSKRSTGFSLFRNHVTIAFRSLTKHRVNTAINLVGLTLGLTVGLMINYHIQQELNFDRFATQHDRIFRVASHWLNYDPRAKVALPVAPALKEDLPLVEDAVRMMKVLTNDNSGIPVRYGNKKFAEEGFVCVDPEFLQMFDIEMIDGNPAMVLDDAHHVILSEQMARKYFGDMDPIGKILQIEGQFEMEVTGVFKSVNHESHMHFDFLAPMTFMSQERWGQFSFTENWQTAFSWTYLLLRDENDVELVSEQLADFVSRRYPENFGEEYGGFQLLLQPLTEIHVGSDYSGEIKENTSYLILFQLGAVGLIIILIAAINFINLTTARSVMRAREVGIRKTLGARRRQLVYQFLTEAILVTLTSLVLGMLLTLYLLPQFNELLGTTYAFNGTMLLQLLGIGLALAILLTFLAGLYPAFVLSRHHPVKKSISVGHNQSLLRKTFIGLQFISSMIFIVGFIIITEQMDFIRTRGTGVDTDLVLVVNRPPQSIENDVIINAMQRLPEVNQVSAAAGSMPGHGGATWSYHPQGRPRERYRMFTIWGFDSLISTMGMELLSGSDFSSAHDRDSITYIILNQTAVKQLEWDLDEAVGKEFGEYHWRKDTITQGRVVGVVKDFHFQSLREPYRPVAMIYTENDFGNLMIKLNRFEGQKTIARLESVWDELLPDFPFQVTFLDDKVAALYENEEQLKQSVNYFSIIALITSGLGLLGLVSFLLLQRTKEICIRKVLGAGLASLLNTLSREFFTLIIVSFVVAVPLGYFLMDQWLSVFAFRIEIGWFPFLIAFLVLVAVSLVTVGYKSLMTALVNPATMLRDE